VHGITDGDGNLLSWVGYNAFGNLLPGAIPDAGEVLRFADRPFLEAAGLYHNRRRFYDPLTGRFTQEDPTRLNGNDTNLYRYAFNNPGNLTDPFGTAAAIEQGLLDAYLTLIDTLCSFAECVGNLGSGVVRGVINVETTDPVSDAGNCLKDMVPVPDWPPTVCDGLDALKGRAEDQLDSAGEDTIDAVWKSLVGGPSGKKGAAATKKAKKIVDIIVKCGEATEIKIGEEKVGCSK
jgi:RHS repeat-associated protein